MKVAGCTAGYVRGCL